MVRTGIVSHPLEWEFFGYNELQNPRKRYALINYRKLTELLHSRSIEDLKDGRDTGTRKFREKVKKENGNKLIIFDQDR